MDTRTGRREKEYNPLLNGLKVLIGFVIFSFVIYGVVYWSDSVDWSSTGDASEVAAYVAAEMFVEDELVSPSSAKFCPKYKASIQYLDNNTWSIKNCLEAQNSFGAMIRGDYQVEVQYMGDDNWDLNYIRIH